MYFVCRNVIWVEQISGITSMEIFEFVHLPSSGATMTSSPQMPHAA